jgi:perosamine synthetase
MIPLFKVGMSPKASEIVATTLMSGFIGQGPRVDEFEGMLSRYFEREVLTVSSCTAALHLALILCGVTPGDEVISTPLNCTAGSSMIANMGAKIVWADVTSRGVIDPVSVAAHIGLKTKAVMAVDWGGDRPDYKALKSLGVPVIQDAAHSFRTSDPQGDLTTWSFQAIKFLTTGDGGALACSEEQYQRAKLLRWFGLDRTTNDSFRCSQDVAESGWKYNLNDIAASIGIANFELARQNTVKHWKNGERILGGTTLRWVGFVRVRDRAGFIEECTRAGIATSMVHKRNDVHTAFRAASKNPDEARPNLEAYAREYIAVPVGWWLTEKEVDLIEDVVKSWQGKYPVEEG